MQLDMCAKETVTRLHRSCKGNGADLQPLMRATNVAWNVESTHTVLLDHFVFTWLTFDAWARALTNLRASASTCR